MKIEKYDKNGIKLSYAVMGTGKRIMVMLPGMALHSIMMFAAGVEKACESLLHDYTIYLFERRDVLNPGMSAEDMAEDVAVILNDLGIKDIYIFGASQGGMMAQALAANHPELVKCAIFASTLATHNEVSRKFFSKMNELCKSEDIRAINKYFFENVYSKDYQEKNRAAIEKTLDFGTAEGAKRLLVMSESCLNFEFEDRLGDIKCPVLVIGAVNDRVMDPIGSRKLAQKLGCEIYIYPTEAHAAYDEASDYKQRIKAFFDSIE
ncbi:MAG: alpha/beta hydrolase [Lachnospiraceae bacterium]|nr:alpha/beta hydrolase [Candidatus Minthocola equi]